MPQAVTVCRLCVWMCHRYIVLCLGIRFDEIKVMIFSLRACSRAETSVAVRLFYCWLECYSSEY